MPVSADPEPDSLVDTSVAVALVVADHDGHHETVAALRGRTLGLAGHAYFETYSVLTRLPPPARRPPAEVIELLGADFPASRFLDAAAHETLGARLADLGIAGGAVYDALVGSAAKAHQTVLTTRDRRAIDVYRALHVDLEILGH